MIASRTAVKTKLRTVTTTKSWVAPVTDRGLPAKNLPKKRIAKATKTSRVKKYRKLKDRSRNRSTGIEPHLLVPILNKMLPRAPKSDIRRIVAHITVLPMQYSLTVIESKLTVTSLALS